MQNLGRQLKKNGNQIQRIWTRIPSLKSTILRKEYEEDVLEFLNIILFLKRNEVKKLYKIIFNNFSPFVFLFDCYYATVIDFIYFY